MSAVRPTTATRQAGSSPFRQSAPDAEVEDAERRLRQPGNGVGGEEKPHAVADAALRDLLAEPQQERRAGHEAHRHGDAEAQARLRHEPADTLERAGKAEALKGRQRQRDDADVVVELPHSHRARPAQRPQPRREGRDHVDDDACRHVRHDPERENREAAGRFRAHDARRADGQHLQEHVRIDAGQRQEAAKAHDDKRADREEHAPHQPAIDREEAGTGSRLLACHGRSSDSAAGGWRRPYQAPDIFQSAARHRHAIARGRGLAAAWAPRR